MRRLLGGDSSEPDVDEGDAPPSADLASHELAVTAGADPVEAGLGDETVEPVERAAIRRVSTEIEAMPAEQRRLVAGYAYVLARIALADHDVRESELRSMERALTEIGHLSEAQAVLVVEVARTMAMLYGATEDFVVTREFAASATREQREELLRTAFKVGAADEEISPVESRELDEIGKELGFLGHEVDAIREQLDAAPTTD